METHEEEEGEVESRAFLVCACHMHGNYTEEL
jgi:hypothetical protein